MEAYAAVLLAGGAARRMAGRDKPGIPVGGRPMRERVLAAVAAANPRIVVGPPVPLPVGVRDVQEDPPGGGPVAAIAAGLGRLDPATAVVAVLAADLPLLTAGHVDELRRALATAGGGATAGGTTSGNGGTDNGGTSGNGGTRSGGTSSGGHSSGGPGRGVPVDGVCYVDEDGRRQSLCGVWRHDALRAAVRRTADARGGDLAGASMRALLADLTVAELRWPGAGPPPWFDCDTDDDVRRAEEWIEGADR